MSSVGVPSQASSSASQQLLEQWQNSSQDVKTNEDIQTKEEHTPTQTEQPSSQLESTQQVSSAMDQGQQSTTEPKHDLPPLQQEHSHSDQQLLSEKSPQRSEKGQVKTPDQTSNQFPKPDSSIQSSESQQQNIHQQLNVEQQTSTASEANNAAKRMKGSPSIPFQLLIPIIRPHLDKDRAMQLQSVFAKLRVDFANLNIRNSCFLLLS